MTAGFILYHLQVMSDSSVCFQNFNSLSWNWCSYTWLFKHFNSLFCTSFYTLFMLLALQKTSTGTWKDKLNDEGPSGGIRCPLLPLCSWWADRSSTEQGKHSISHCPQGVRTRFLKMSCSYKCCLFRSQEESLQSLEIANTHPEKPLKTLQLSSQHLWSPSSPLALGNCR